MYTPLSDQHKLHAMKLNNARDFFSSFITGTTQRQKCDTFTVTTNTKSLAKEFSKILIFEYFGYLKVGFDVFFDADSESPRMT